MDIGLNPRIGHGRMKEVEQTAIATPGKNQKRYLAGGPQRQHRKCGVGRMGKEEFRNFYSFVG